MKRFLHLLLLLLLIPCLTLTVLAEETAASGTCGENASWEFNETTGKLTISGTGAMTETGIKGAPWYDLRTKIKTVEIAEGITNIPRYAFQNVAKMTAVQIPESVTSIGKHAFYNCKLLKTVEIPSAVTTIGIQAFNGCVSLREITIPDGVTGLGEYVFYGCSSLEAVNLGQGVSEIGMYAFCGCSALESIEFPESVSKIRGSAFDGCTSLQTLVFRGEAVDLDSEVFANCTGLKNLVISGGVSEISWGCFSGCTGLETVEFGEGVTDIQEYAFGECVNLRKVVFPKSLSKIHREAFSHESLTEIWISDLAAWNDVAFYYYDESYDSETGEDIITLRSGYRDYFMDQRKAKSLYLNGEKITDLVIPKEITSISEYLFAHTTIESVAFEAPETVETIGEYAFYYCENLKSIEIPTGTDTLPNSFLAFSEGVESIVIPDNITTIRYEAFQGCSGLKRVEMTDSVTELGFGAFFGCKALERVVLSDSITELQGLSYEGTFEDCVSLTSIHLPAQLKEIEDNVFCGCTSLKEIAVPATLEIVADDAFEGCTALKTVYYEGSAVDREGQNFSEEGNAYFHNAEWKYNTAVTLGTPEVKTANVVSSGKPRLSWETVDGASRYRIYRATSKTGSFKYLATTEDTSYTDKDIRAGSNYYYKVKAMGENTESFFSAVVNRCCDLKRPVVTLKVDTASGKPKVTFEKISGAEKYYIVRSTSEKGTYSKLATITGTTYIDKTAKAGKTYYYKVKALHAKDSADSAYSAVTSRVCDLKKPVVTIFLKDGDPRIKWDAISGAQKYMVYRATSKDGDYTHVKTTKTSTSYTDTAAKAGKTYYYKVRAIHENPDANSAYSAVKYIKAK